MLYILYIMGFALAKVIPLRACYAIAELIARVYFMFGKKDKESLRKNLRVVLGEDVSAEEIEKHVLQIFINFAKYLADFFRFPRFTEEYVNKDINISGIEYLDGCLKEGKGAIALSIHLGNWELGAAILGGLGYPISALVLEHSSKRINDFFNQQRAINNLKVIPIGMKVKDCFRSLRKNEVFAIMGDKDYTSNGIEVDFFGKKAILPKGPAVISLKTGAPIVFCVLSREKNDKFKFSFEKPIEFISTGDVHEDVKSLMGEYIKLFEKYIRKYPDQWYAFRKVWNQE